MGPINGLGLVATGLTLNQKSASMNQKTPQHMQNNAMSSNQQLPPIGLGNFPELSIQNSFSRGPAPTSSSVGAKKYVMAPPQ
jgi:hypothetical protein